MFLKAEQLAAMTPEQINALSEEQLGGFNQQQLSRMPTEALQVMLVVGFTSAGVACGAPERPF